jgi:hypothetical protein
MRRVANAASAVAFLALARVALHVATLPSCLPMNNASSDGGAETGTSTETADGQCTKIETAFCNRMVACAIAVASLSQCVADGKVNCCADKCSATSSTSDQSVAACVDAVTNLDCNSVATGVTPPACAGIPKVQ